MPIINRSIPDFSVQAFHNGEFKTVTSDSVKGKWSIFLFYPADFTFVCPTELEDMAKHYDELQALGVEVYAVSCDTPGLNTFEIGSERFYVVLHRNHPLSEQAKITAKQLRSDNTLILLGDGHCLKDHIVEICKFRNEISPHSFREASLNTLVQMVVNDMGLTLVPEMALPSLRPLPDIRTIPLDVPAPHRRLALVTRPNYPRTVELEALMGLFRDALNNIRASIPAA